MKLFKSATFALALLLSFSVTALAQVGASGTVNAVQPLTRDVGAIQTFTNQVAATVTSADQSGFGVSRVICVYRQASFTGTPSVTFAIQNKDAASGQYYTLITSGAVAAFVAVSPISAGAGVATTANIGAGVPVARTWRTSVTFAGSSTPIIVAGTVGCSVQ